MKCCMNCVAPKRHEACWGSCPEYLKEKAEHDQKKAELYKRSRVSWDIYFSRADRVDKARKRHRR